MTEWYITGLLCGELASPRSGFAQSRIVKCGFSPSPASKLNPTSPVNQRIHFPIDLDESDNSPRNQPYNDCLHGCRGEHLKHKFTISNANLLIYLDDATVQAPCLFYHALHPFPLKAGDLAYLASLIGAEPFNSGLGNGNAFLVAEMPHVIGVRERVNFDSRSGFLR